MRKGLGDISQFNSLIQASAIKYGVEPGLLASVIQQESSGNPNAVNSSSGAQGLMQLLPSTASWLGVGDPFNPAQNIDGGAKFLSQLLTKYNGDQSLALAAYNFGPGNVDSGKSWPTETQNYVKDILGRIGDSFTSVTDYVDGNVSDMVSSGSGYDWGQIGLVAGVGIAAILVLL